MPTTNTGDVERARIAEVLAQVGGSVLKAAPLLGYEYRTLYRRMHEMGFAFGKDRFAQTPSVTASRLASSSASNTLRLYFARQTEGDELVCANLSEDPLRDLKIIQTANGVPLEMIAIGLPDEPAQPVFQKLAAFHVKGTWYLPNPEVIRTANEIAKRSKTQLETEGVSPEPPPSTILERAPTVQSVRGFSFHEKVPLTVTYNPRDALIDRVVRNVMHKSLPDSAEITVNVSRQVWRSLGCLVDSTGSVHLTDEVRDFIRSQALTSVWRNASLPKSINCTVNGLSKWQSSRALEVTTKACIKAFFDGVGSYNYDLTCIHDDSVSVNISDLDASSQTRIKLRISESRDQERWSVMKWFELSGDNGSIGLRNLFERSHGRSLMAYESHDECFRRYLVERQLAEPDWVPDAGPPRWDFKQKPPAPEPSPSAA